jgi:tRNA(fMet)-specific endonuclease VapC
LHSHPAASAARSSRTLSTIEAGRGRDLGDYLESQLHEQAMRQLMELAGLMPVIEQPLRAGQFYAAMRAELEVKGEMIGNNDLWIAAHARAAGLTLVTNNEHEFRRIQGLKIQNWVTDRG